MKKAVALFLCFVMLFSVTAYASPYMGKVNSKVTIIDRQTDYKGSLIREISTFNGSMFYYEETENCRVSMEMITDGTIIVFKAEFEEKSEPNPTIKKGVFTNENKKLKKLSLEEKINQLSELSNRVLTNELKLDVVTAQEIGVIFASENPIISTRSIADKVYDALESREGAEYSDQFLYGMDYRDTYGALYRSKTFQVSTYYSWQWGVSTLISAISMYVGFTTTQVIQALGSIALTGAGAALALDEAANSNKYNANVLYEKDVKVNGQVVYTSTKNELNFALAFESENSGDAIIDPRYDDVDSDYNESNSTLIETGIDIYLENLN